MNRRWATGVSVFGLTMAATAVVWAGYQRQAAAHCQVPCGIYDDAARITRIREDAATIHKAIDEINELVGKQSAQAFNQASRWITTKETHASHIIDVVSEYFLTQKVKPVAAGSSGYDAYLKNLADHHRVMVAAMKTKQKCDPATSATLNAAIDKLATHYGK